MVSSDTKKELKQLPKRFQQLVQTKGPKAAIEISFKCAVFLESRVFDFNLTLCMYLLRLDSSKTNDLHASNHILLYNRKK